jgi:hypothetical protein
MKCLWCTALRANRNKGKWTVLSSSLTLQTLTEFRRLPAFFHSVYTPPLRIHHWFKWSCFHTATRLIQCFAKARHKSWCDWRISIFLRFWGATQAAPRETFRRNITVMYILSLREWYWDHEWRIREYGRKAWLSCNADCGGNENSLFVCVWGFSRFLIFKLCVLGCNNVAMFPRNIVSPYSGSRCVGWGICWVIWTQGKGRWNAAPS